MFNSSNPYCDSCGKPFTYVGDVIGNIDQYICTCNKVSQTAEHFENLSLKKEIQQLKIEMKFLNISFQLMQLIYIGVMF